MHKTLVNLGFEKQLRTGVYINNKTFKWVTYSISSTCKFYTYVY